MKINEFLEDVDKTFVECKKIAEIKTRMYGSEGLGQLGQKGEFIQIHRKYLRLKQMMWKDNFEVSDTERDTLRDTLIDMINYCVISLSCLDRGVFKKNEETIKG